MSQLIIILIASVPFIPLFAILPWWLVISLFAWVIWCSEKEYQAEKAQD